jgi:hypothetical protein
MYQRHNPTVPNDLPEEEVLSGHQGILRRVGEVLSGHQGISIPLGRAQSVHQILLIPFGGGILKIIISVKPDLFLQ